jgi:hypothetical protein
MKKIFVLTTALLLSNLSHAAVSSKSQKIFSDMLNQAGLRNYWSQDSSLWVENPGGMSKMDLEKIGNTLCGYGQGFFVVTFWQNINGPSGQIVKVTCRN